MTKTPTPYWTTITFKCGGMRSAHTDWTTVNEVKPCPYTDPESCPHARYLKLFRWWGCRPAKLTREEEAS